MENIEEKIIEVLNKIRPFLGFSFLLTPGPGLL